MNYWKENYQKETEIFLTKKLLIYAEKNKHLIAEKVDEKVHIINNIVPKFSYQFIEVPVELFKIFADLFFITFNLYYLINFYRLSTLIPLLVTFILVNLLWFTLFNYFFSQTNKNNYQNWEKSQIKIWLENLTFKNNVSQNSEEIIKLLDSNYQKVTKVNLFSVLYQLPSLIIPSITVLFLFLYYYFYCGGQGGLEWSIYFVANDLQRIVRKIGNFFNLLPNIFSLKENQQKIKNFFN